MSCLSSSARLTPSRIFLFLGLAATLLLLSYQLILYRSTEELGVLVGNESPNTEVSAPPAPEPLSTTESVKQQPTPEPTPEPIPESTPEPAPAPTKELVFAAMEASNMSWVEEHLPKWTANIYRADASEGLTVPINKGNEAMVYLTYERIFPKSDNPH